MTRGRRNSLCWQPDLHEKENLADICFARSAVDGSPFSKAEQYCALRGLPAILIFGTRRRLRAGESLFENGAKLEYLYVILSGAVKLTLNVEGAEVVAGFSLEGDLLGDDAIFDGYHGNSAICLGDTVVSTVRYCEFNRLCTANADFANAFLTYLSSSMLSNFRHIEMLSKGRAQEKVAFFLLWLSRRMTLPGSRLTILTLAMSRYEIGSYLDLTYATVTKVLGQLQKTGVAFVRRNKIQILDYDKLMLLSGSQLQPEQ